MLKVPEYEPIGIHTDYQALLKELLNNPRVESISIKIDKVGNVETTNVEAKLKEMI